MSNPNAVGELAAKTENGQSTLYNYDVFGNLRRVDLPNGIVIEYLTDGAQRRIGRRINGQMEESLLYFDNLKPAATLDLEPVTRYWRGREHYEEKWHRQIEEFAHDHSRGLFKYFQDARKDRCGCN